MRAMPSSSVCRPLFPVRLAAWDARTELELVDYANNCIVSQVASLHSWNSWNPQQQLCSGYLLYKANTKQDSHQVALHTGCHLHATLAQSNGIGQYYWAPTLLQYQSPAPLPIDSAFVCRYQFVEFIRLVQCFQDPSLVSFQRRI